MTTATPTIPARFADLPTTFDALSALHAPRPIRNARQRARAQKLIELLAGYRLNRDQDDYLDVLSMTVEAYDDEHAPTLADTRPVHERLAWLVEQSGTTRAELGQVLDASLPLVCMILSGKRRLTTKHITRLSERFKLEPGYFLDLARARQAV